MSQKLAMRFNLSIPKNTPSSLPPVQPKLQQAQPQQYHPRYSTNYMANSWKGVPCRQFNSSVKKGCGCGGG